MPQGSTEGQEPPTGQEAWTGGQRQSCKVPKEGGESPRLSLAWLWAPRSVCSLPQDGRYRGWCSADFKQSAASLKLDPECTPPTPRWGKGESGLPTVPGPGAVEPGFRALLTHGLNPLHFASEPNPAHFPRSLSDRRRKLSTQYSLGDSLAPSPWRPRCSQRHPPWGSGPTEGQDTMCSDLWVASPFREGC